MTSTQKKAIRNKVGVLRLAEELGNVSRACQVMGYSRETFYRYKQAAEEGGFEAPPLARSENHAQLKILEEVDRSPGQSGAIVRREGRAVDLHELAITITAMPRPLDALASLYGPFRRWRPSRCPLREICQGVVRRRRSPRLAFLRCSCESESRGVHLPPESA